MSDGFLRWAGSGGEGAGAGGWGGLVDLLGLDAGVDEEAYADAEGDEGAGGSAEDVTLLKDGGEGDEKEGDADSGSEQDDAGEADVGAAADQADGGTALGEGDLGCGGRRDEPLAMAARRSWLSSSRLRALDQLPTATMPRTMTKLATGTMKGLLKVSLRPLSRIMGGSL